MAHHLQRAYAKEAAACQATLNDLDKCWDDAKAASVATKFKKETLYLKDERQLYTTQDGWAGAAKDGEDTNTDADLRAWAEHDNGTIALADGRQLYVHQDGRVGVAKDGEHANTDAANRTWTRNVDGTVSLADGRQLYAKPDGWVGVAKNGFDGNQDASRCTWTRGTAWTAEQWMASLNPASVLVKVFGPDQSVIDDATFLEFLKKVANHPNAKSLIFENLDQRKANEKFADVILTAAQEMTNAGAVCGDDLNSKFNETGSFEFAFGGLPDFSNGLESFIGSPNPKLMDAMAFEHTVEKDSVVKWTAGNYGICTCHPGAGAPTESDHHPDWPKETKNNTQNGVDISRKVRSAKDVGDASMLYHRVIVAEHILDAPCCLAY